MAENEKKMADAVEMNPETVNATEEAVANPFDEHCEKHKALADTALAGVREALNAKDLEQYGTRMAALKKVVDAWNKMICQRAYAEFLKADNPMIAAVQAFYVKVVKIKEDRDSETNTITGVNFEHKNARIDLEKFCEFGDLSLAWARDSARLLALLSLREVNVYEIKPSDLANKSFYFATQVRAKKAGETPDSNTQIVRLLQKIIDEAIFVDDGKGKNKYKCTNHDLAFIQDAVTKMDTKSKCTIAMLNERQFKTVMMSVFAHCLGEAYKVKPAKVSVDN